MNSLLPSVLGALSLVPGFVGRAGQPAPPFAMDIAAFKAKDRISPPAANQILFIGSSSFTRWTDVQRYFPKHQILNRGFGGSTLTDVTRYVKDIVFPYRPKEIVIYCGENDLAYVPSLTPDQVFDRFLTLFKEIRDKLPTIPIVYISMKPSPSRWRLAPKFVAANDEIQRYCLRQPHTVFVTVWKAMLASDGLPKMGIYASDYLHMNAAGYRIWAPLIEPTLQ